MKTLQYTDVVNFSYDIKMEMAVGLPYLSISHWGKRVTNGSSFSGHGEQGGDSQGYSCRNSFGVNPEGEPGDNDQHAGGHVDGQHVVGELPLECQLHQETAVFTCNLG